MRSKGKVTYWDDEKGFGFIEPLEGGNKVFLHITALHHPLSRPELGQVVTYTPGTDSDGRPRASQVTLPGERLFKRRKRQQSVAVILAPLFLLAVLYAVLSGTLPPAVLGFYLLVCLITFISYALDKAAAQKGLWRTRESTLHLMALVGGWPGALLAQQFLRHKSQKHAFLWTFWFTVSVNLMGFAWLLTPAGSATIRQLLAGL